MRFHLKVLFTTLLIGLLLFPGFSRAGFFGLDDLFRGFKARFFGEVEKNLKSEKVENEEPVFVETLSRGLSGEGVLKLQKLLKKFPSIYPRGLVTGYFGKLTEQAVKRFQRKVGLAPVGRVGPRTRAKLNELASQRGFDGKVTKSLSVAPGVTVDNSLKPFQRQDEGSLNSEEVGDYSVRPRPDYNLSKIEKGIFQRVNEVRKSAGEKALEFSEDLAAVARKHSSKLAEINEILVDNSKPCDYPLITHYGFELGSNVGERLDNSGISYSLAGENVVLFSLSKNSVYSYSLKEGKADVCQKVNPVRFFATSTDDDKKDKLSREIARRKALLESVSEVEWSNREWKDEESAARRATRLWRNSFEHRQNITEGRFSHSGVGTARVGNYLIVTQVFIRK